MTRLLLVDDEVGLRRGLAEFLRASGEEVQEAGGLGPALTILREPYPDLVVTDLNLGDGTGLDLAAWLAKRTGGTRVIVVTGYASKELLTGDLPAGVDLILEKPVRPRALKKAIHQLVQPQSGDHAPATVTASEGVIESREAQEQRVLRLSLWGEEME